MKSSIHVTTVSRFFQFIINKLSMYNVQNIAEMTPPCFTPLHKSKYCVVYDAHETTCLLSNITVILNININYSNNARVNVSR